MPPDEPVDERAALNAQISATATVFGRDPAWVLSFDREGRLLTRATAESFEKRARFAPAAARPLAVTLIALIGLGGQAFRDRHREATLDALLSMPLDRRDLIYLSPFVEGDGSAYAARRAEEGSAPLTPAEIEAETTLWTETLRARGLRVGRYDIREFVY